jgi:hypothetical protein
MNIREIGWSSMDWIDVSQNRDQWRTLLNVVIKVKKMKWT